MNIKKRTPYYIVTCGLSGSTKFFHIILKRHDIFLKSD